MDGNSIGDQSSPMLVRALQTAWSTSALQMRQQYRRATQKLGNHTFGAAVWGAGINTCAMTDIETLADRLLANFRTLRLPPEALPVRPNPEPTDWWAMAKARRDEKRVLY